LWYEYGGKEVLFMGKWKIAEVVLLAVSALVAAAKSLFKFITCLGKMKKKKKSKAPVPA
jgi:hypothetical protein